MAWTALENAFVFGLIVFRLLFYNLVGPLSQNRHIVDRVTTFVARLHLHSLHYYFGLSSELLLLHLHDLLPRTLLIL